LETQNPEDLETQNPEDLETQNPEDLETQKTCIDTQLLNLPSCFDSEGNV
jgi:hypothetical protein